VATISLIFPRINWPNFMEGSKSRVCLAYPTSHVGMLQHTQRSIPSIPGSAAYAYCTSFPNPTFPSCTYTTDHIINKCPWTGYQQSMMDYSLSLNFIANCRNRFCYLDYQSTSDHSIQYIIAYRVLYVRVWWRQRNWPQHHLSSIHGRHPANLQRRFVIVKYVNHRVVWQGKEHLQWILYLNTAIIKSARRCNN